MTTAVWREIGSRAGSRHGTLTDVQRVLISRDLVATPAPAQDHAAAASLATVTATGDDKRMTGPSSTRSAEAGEFLTAGD